MRITRLFDQRNINKQMINELLAELNLYEPDTYMKVYDLIEGLTEVLFPRYDYDNRFEYIKEMGQLMSHRLTYINEFYNNLSNQSVDALSELQAHVLDARDIELGTLLEEMITARMEVR